LSSAPLGFIKQSQNQTVFGIVLNMSGVRSVVPGPQWTPLTGRLALAAGQINDNLVLGQRSGDIKNVDK
jgi:hypothetical protein